MLEALQKQEAKVIKIRTKARGKGNQNNNEPLTFARVFSRVLIFILKIRIKTTARGARGVIKLQFLLVFLQRQEAKGIKTKLRNIEKYK